LPSPEFGSVLSLFLQQPGAPIDHNLVERAPEESHPNRKNALFYKTGKAPEWAISS
jgi:hypothetical protein